ncbi:cation:dicarboxylate symporter family transporter [Thalassotalea marina]|uniref:Solute-binding protein family 3/N-terminal domain-containing protein n=1 Tax=Thalassotalea marina TaxID=1673741 RepID=A0A919BQ62_9GAMM|nr:cation:dicarboxylase symporter family transporter [Thalassotalea marina]GHG05895.1 hypothetical protein GCM10017161_39310 [Thalassotalea marina]
MFSKIPLAAQIVIGLFIGLTVGFVHEQVYSPVSSAASGFVMLLQMTALPYISLSLITGIGGLTPGKISSAVKTTLITAILLTSVMLCFVFLAPLTFPEWKNAEFYSLSSIRVAEPVSFIDQFISANPFSAFANGVIPAVVVFSLFLGAGLMKVQHKRYTLLVLINLQKSVANVNSLVMKLAPFGVACIGWNASATLESGQLDGLTVLFFAAIFVSCTLAFVVLPALVAVFTPFHYRQVLETARAAMITAFATGSFFAVIPLIVEKTSELIKSQDYKGNTQTKIASLLVPITFSMPVGGKLLALLFVLFSAWFSGAYIGAEQYVKLIFLGMPQLFGSPTAAIQHLLELFNVSGSMFDMYLVADNMLIGRLNALMSVAFATCLPLIVVASMSNQLSVNFRNFFKKSMLVVSISVIAFYGLRLGLENLAHQYEGYSKFIERDFIYQQPKTRYKKEPQSEPYNELAAYDVIARVKERGFIRVGYFRDDLPFAFHNKEGKLVGFDIELINLLALDLGVEIEYVRIFHDQAASLLADGYLDMTTGIPLIPDNLTQLTLTDSYVQQHVAFLVKDNRRAEFTDWNKIKANKELIIGIPEAFYYRRAVEQYFTKQTAWEISTPRLFFKEKYQHIDAMLFGAAASSGWTLLYPEYTVVSPKPALPPLFMAFPINKNDHVFNRFMANWIAMKKQSGTIDKLFNYWIEGKKPEVENND